MTFDLEIWRGGSPFLSRPSSNTKVMGQSSRSKEENVTFSAIQSTDWNVELRKPLTVKCGEMQL